MTESVLTSGQRWHFTRSGSYRALLGLVVAFDLATAALMRSYGLTDVACRAMLGAPPGHWVIGEIFFIGDLLNLTDCLGDNCSLI